MATPVNRGMHHMALVTRNMEETCRFWIDVLGCKPKVLLHLPGEDPFADQTWDVPVGSLANAKHYFFDIGNGDAVAFFDIGDQVDAIPDSMRSRFAHHLAIGLDSEAELHAAREHLLAHGVDCSDVVDHLFCKSIYFNSPEGHYLEYAVYSRNWTPERPFLQDRQPTPAALRAIGEDAYRRHALDFEAGVAATYDEARRKLLADETP